MADTEIKLPVPHGHRDLVFRTYKGNGATLTSTGPRGGYVCVSIGEAAMHVLAHALLEHVTGEFHCRACFRTEPECSSEPCDDVIADRES